MVNPFLLVFLYTAKSHSARTILQKHYNNVYSRLLTKIRCSHWFKPEGRSKWFLVDNIVASPLRATKIRRVTEPLIFISNDNNCSWGSTTQWYFPCIKLPAPHLIKILQSQRRLLFFLRTVDVWGHCVQTGVWLSWKISQNDTSHKFSPMYSKFQWPLGAWQNPIWC